VETHFGGEDSSGRSISVSIVIIGSKQSRGYYLTDENRKIFNSKPFEKIRYESKAKVVSRMCYAEDEDS